LLKKYTGKTNIVTIVAH